MGRIVWFGVISKGFAAGPVVGVVASALGAAATAGYFIGKKLRLKKAPRTIWNLWA